MPIVTASATTTTTATPEAVWEVLADFPNIADYTSQVKTSDGTSAETGGVGATRSCDLNPAGSVMETVREWEPGEKIVITVDETKMIPVRRSRTTFTIGADADGATTLTMEAEAEPKGGIFAGLIGKRLARGLPKAASALVGDLTKAAEQRT